MSHPSYLVREPENRHACVVFASPHSGRAYSDIFLRSSALDAHTIRSSEDAFIDLLFANATNFGAPFLTAGAPRAFVDLNRACDELDPAVIEGVRSQGHNPRVASGLGVIPRVVANGRAIYRGKISLGEAKRRIETYWKPYHLKLQKLLDEARKMHGQAVLIDCHSMPHEAMDGMVRGGMRRPDVVLGDRFGAAASPSVMEQVEEAFRSAGFVTTRNAPFAGAYIAQAYGRPSRRQHAIQVEIDRSLYMHESTIQPNAQFQDVKERLTQAISQITLIGQDRLPLAAE